MKTTLVATTSFKPPAVLTVTDNSQRELAAKNPGSVSVFGRVGAAYAISPSPEPTGANGVEMREFPISAEAVLRHRRMSRPRFFRTIGPWLSYL